MLIKWIRADVVDRASFDRGQRRWSVLAGAPGFAGQQGGWSSRERSTARIAARWDDVEAHDRFLVDGHDDVADAQRGSYAALDIRLLDVVHTTGEPASGEPTGGAPRGRVLRSAWCPTRAGRVEHALQSQQQLWMPAMHEAGMLAGLTALTVDREAILVLSWWPDLATHDVYQREHVHRLREQADTDGDLAAVHGDLVALEPAWTVAPTRPGAGTG